MLELYSLTIHQAQTMMRQGEFTAVELTESVLSRIEAVEEESAGLRQYSARFSPPNGPAS